MRGEQHRALPAINVPSERARIGLEQSERAGPIAILAARFQHGAARPAERRRGARGFLGISPRADRIVAAMRFDEQPMQAERLGVGAACHGAEGALGALAVARELRRLCVQQQRERLGGREPVDRGGVFLRGRDVAGADRDQPLDIAS